MLFAARKARGEVDGRVEEGGQRGEGRVKVREERRVRLRPIRYGEVDAAVLRHVPWCHRVELPLLLQMLVLLLLLSGGVLPVRRPRLRILIVVRHTVAPTHARQIGRAHV